MRRSPLLGAATVAVLAAGALATTGVLGSSHREAPRIMLDPSADNTDLYAFTAPDAPGKLTIVSNWVPLREPGGRAVLRQARSRGPLLRQDRQHRRRRRGRRLPLAVPQPLPQPELVPVRGADGRLDRRPEPQLRPDLRPLLETLQERASEVTSKRDRARRAGRAGQRRPEDDAQLRGRRRRAPCTALPGGGKTFVGPVDDPFFVDLGSVFDGINIDKPGRPGDRARQPGRRPGRPRGLQRPLVRAAGPGAEVTRDGKARLRRQAAQRRRRRVVVDRAPGRSRSTAARQQVALGAGQPARQPADQRGDHPDRPEGQVQRDVPEGRPEELRRRRAEPRAGARSSTRCSSLGVKENDRTDIVQALLTGLPGLTQISPKAVPGRHAEGQPRRAADRRAEPLRRAGR